MEEILASIRKIIAEDAPGHAAAQMGSADVIELTEVIEEGRPVPPPATDDGRLVSENTADRSARAMDALRLAVRREAERQAVSLGEGSNRTVEDIVQELVRPMLREWMDTNLAPLVERLVEQEIRAIAHRSGGT
jgi:cell pole-organizing protein PopZ